MRMTSHKFCVWICANTLVVCALTQTMVHAAAPVVEQSVVSRPQHEYAHVRVAFTPGDNIEAQINKEIRAARSSVRMQAYFFTSKAIADELIKALKRGVKVEVIADAAGYTNGGAPVLPRLAQAGAEVSLNDKHKTSHNKIIIVDAELTRGTVITGSYNFTRAAQTQNAENVVILSGNVDLVKSFYENWQFHRSQSTLLQ